MTFKNLDASTRKHMQDEVERDIREGTLYKSPRLSSRGILEYPNMLQMAVSSGDDRTLSESLRGFGILNTIEERKNQPGASRSQRFRLLHQRQWGRGNSIDFMHAGYAREPLQKESPQ